MTGGRGLLVAPEDWPEPVPQDKPVYKVPVKDVKWLPSPNKIDAQLRSSLDAFAGRDERAVAVPAQPIELHVNGWIVPPHRVGAVVVVKVESSCRQLPP